MFAWFFRNQGGNAYITTVPPGRSNHGATPRRPLLPPVPPWRPLRLDKLPCQNRGRNSYYRFSVGECVVNAIVNDTGTGALAFERKRLNNQHGGWKVGRVRGARYNKAERQSHSGGCKGGCRRDDGKGRRSGTTEREMWWCDGTEGGLQHFI